MERFNLELPAHMSTADQEEIKSVNAVTSDISAGGAFFNTDSSLPVGTRMAIDLVLPLDELKRIEGKRANISIKGHVVRIDRKGMAVRFDRRFRISPSVL